MRLSALLLTLAVAALAAASPASAGWTLERVAAHIGTGGYGDLTLAGNARGDTALLFETSHGLSLALARPGGGFGQARAVPHAGVRQVGGDSNLGVAIDEHGSALVIWTENDHTRRAPPSSRDDDCCERVRVALLRAGSKRFSGPKTISPAGIDAFPQAFSLVNGRVGVAWREGSEVAARFSPRGLRLGPAVRATGDRALAAMPLRNGPVLTFFRSHYVGGLVERWSVWDLRAGGAGAPVVRKRFSRTSTLPTPDLAADARGDQALTWSEQVGTGGYRVFAAARSRNAPFHPRRVSGQVSVDELHVAIGPTGAAAAAWTDGQQLFTASRRAGRPFGNGVGFGPRQTGVFFDDIQIACNASGLAFVAWRQEKGQAFEHQHAAFRSRGGRMVNDRDFGRVSNYGSPHVTAIDDHGDARLAWANDAVYAARGQLR
jgi:hypothetical protein